MTLIGLAGLATLAPVASAQSARPASNTGADQAAMAAYRSYLSAITLGAPAAAARANLVVTGVAASCPGALSDLNQLSSGQLAKSALTAFGREVDAALDLAYVGAQGAALNHFAAALSGLTWATPSQSATPTHLINSERALAALTPPSLCRDATSLDGAPLSEPTTTKRFLARYRAVSASLSVNLASFQSLLLKFETAAASKVVTQINTLVSQYSALSSATEQSDADAVLSDLGIASS